MGGLSFNGRWVADARLPKKVSILGQRLVIQVFVDYRSSGSVAELRRAVGNANAKAPRPIDISVLISSQPALLSQANGFGLVERQVSAEHLLEPWGIARVRNHLLADATVLIAPDLDVEWRITHLGVLASGEV